MRCLLLLAALLFVSASAAQPVVYDAREYGLDDGLPSDAIRELHEDAMGFVWAATDEGIARFDGYR